MTNDSHLFRTREQLESDGWTLVGNVFERPAPERVERMLPLYEAKMIHHFDHRWATPSTGEDIADLTNATTSGRLEFSALPRYWVPELRSTAANGPLTTKLAARLPRHRP